MLCLGDGRGMSVLFLGGVKGKEGKGGGGCIALHYTTLHVPWCATVFNVLIRDMGWTCISIFAYLGDQRCAAPHIFLKLSSSEKNDGIFGEGFDALRSSSNASS